MRKISGSTLIELLVVLTGDPLYRRMADEMAYFIARNIHHCPGKPWDGGAVHAIDQRTGKYWNSSPCTGQVDTGMSSGNALAALEKWLTSREGGV